MRPIDAEARIKEIARSLDVATFLAKMREFEKGGLPGQSMSDGRGSAESPCPVAVASRPKDAPPWRAHSEGADHPDRILGVNDPTDREIRVDRLAVEQDLRHAATALVHASQIINSWTIPRTDDTEKAKALQEDGPKGSGACSNVWCSTVCSGIGNDRLRHGRCRPCYRVFTLEGRDRDPRRVDQLTNPDSAA